MLRSFLADLQSFVDSVCVSDEDYELTAVNAQTARRLHESSLMVFTRNLSGSLAALLRGGDAKNPRAGGEELRRLVNVVKAAVDELRDYTEVRGGIHFSFCFLFGSPFHVFMFPYPANMTVVGTLTLLLR